MARNSTKYQYFGTFCVSLLGVVYGASSGWASPSLSYLTSSDSHLKSGAITTEEASWIGAMLSFGGIFGNLLFGWLANYWGRKRTLYFITLPILASWILIIYANTVSELLFARFLAGLAGGGVFVLYPLYVAEISEDKVRGTLGSTLILSCNFGLLLSYILGNYLSYFVVPMICMVFPVIFLFGFYFMPDTPIFLADNNKFKEAKHSLRCYRNLRRDSQIQITSEQFQIEFEKITKNEMDFNEDVSKITWNDFNTPVARKAFLISIVLMALNQFCGCFAMLHYTAAIFKESGSNLSPNMSAIVVGAIQLAGAYCSTFLVERAGRKILLILSSTGTGVGLAIFGTFTYMKDVLNADVSSVNWIPIVSFSFVVFIASWGLLTLPFLVVTEILPEKLRSFGTTFCFTLLWAFAFLAVKFFPLLTTILGMHGCMFLFTTFTFSGAIFIMIFLPETKGRSFDEIQKLL